MKYIFTLLMSFLVNSIAHSSTVLNNENPAVISRTTSIMLNEKIDKTFPLFTPYEESLWAPEWEIEELTPQNKIIGKGFIFKPKGSDSIWIISRFDKATYQIQYTVHDIPRGEFRIIDVSLSSNAETTKASVSYTITSTKAKNLESMETEWSKERYRQKILNWQAMINNYLEQN